MMWCFWSFEGKSLPARPELACAAFVPNLYQKCDYKYFPAFYSQVTEWEHFYGISTFRFPYGLKEGKFSDGPSRLHQLWWWILICFIVTISIVIVITIIIVIIITNIIVIVITIIIRNITITLSSDTDMRGCSTVLFLAAGFVMKESPFLQCIGSLSWWSCWWG